jgi:hypothetical protein
MSHFNTRGKTIKEIQELALTHNIPITSVEDAVIKGWAGKPKGIKHLSLQTALTS